MVRVGLGFDSHPIVKGSGRVVVGGVVVLEGMRVLAHSDGDVLVHALVDALLGASRLGDIGMLFPDSDRRYEGARSMDLLIDVWHRIKGKGFGLVNVDAVVVSSSVMIARFRGEIIKNISEALGVGRDKVWVKGKRPEGSFPENGISSMCVVLLEEL